jgi:hypothetical protein
MTLWSDNLDLVSVKNETLLVHGETIKLKFSFLNCNSYHFLLEYFEKEEKYYY